MSRSNSAIGLSNFSEIKVEEILAEAEIKPAVDQVRWALPHFCAFVITHFFFQVELHLYNPQLKLVSYLKSKDIVPQAFSPLGSANSSLLNDEDAGAIAQKYSLQTSDILLGYLRTSLLSSPSIASESDLPFL